MFSHPLSFLVCVFTATVNLSVFSQPPSFSVCLHSCCHSQLVLSQPLSFLTCVFTATVILNVCFHSHCQSQLKTVPHTAYCHRVLSCQTVEFSSQWFTQMAVTNRFKWRRNNESNQLQYFCHRKKKGIGTACLSSHSFSHDPTHLFPLSLGPSFLGVPERRIAAHRTVENQLNFWTHCIKGPSQLCRDSTENAFWSPLWAP